MRNGERALLFTIGMGLVYLGLLVVVLRLGLGGVRAQLARLADATERLADEAEIGNDTPGGVGEVT